MMTPQSGEMVLVVDELLVLDAASGTQVSSWAAPRERWIDFGENNQAFFTFEYYSAGPGGGSVELYVQRTASYGSDMEEFEDMNSSAILLSRSHSWTTYPFGRDGDPSDKSPMGMGRIRVVNTDGSNHAVVRLRAWVTLQSYRAPAAPMP